MGRKRKIRKETRHADDCECCYCGAMFDGAEATNYELYCPSVKCPECGKENALDIIAYYRCQPIDEER